MGARILLLGAAALLPCSGASTQPLPPDPDPAAMEIAQAMLAVAPFLNPAADRPREERQLEADLLYEHQSEPPCDRANAECLAAARAVAHDYAPAMRRRAERLRDRLLAYGVMDRLGPEQRQRLAAHLRSAEGRDFVALWNQLFQRSASPVRYQEIQCRAAAGLEEPITEARRVFRERTAALPRVQETRPYIVPPVPPPPPTC